MTSDDDTEHYPWCVEHDPTGTCLSDVARLADGGAAWIEGSTSPKIVISLGPPSRGHLPELLATDARQIAAALENLADQIDGTRDVPTTH